MDIFIHRDGEDYGPFSVDEINDLLAAEDLVPDDLAWFDGADGWIPLSELAEQAHDALASDEEIAEAAESETEVEAEPVLVHESASQLPDADEFGRLAEPAPEAHAEFATEAAHQAEPEPAAEVVRAPASQVNHRVQSPPPTGLVPGPFVAPSPIAVKRIVREAAPPWVPGRRDTTGPLPLPSSLARVSQQASGTVSPSSPAHAAAAVNGPVISEKEAHQMAKKFTRSALVNPEHTSAVRKVIVGGLLFVVGIGVTIISYQAADHKPGGGVYILGWGAIAFGAFLFIRGLMEIFSD